MSLDDANDYTIDRCDTTENLITLARNGDAEAFIHLMDKYKIDLYKLGMTLLHNDDDVGDAMQDTVLKAYKHLKKLHNIESFKSWLLKIMVNECTNILRARKKITFFEKFLKREEKVYFDNYNLENQLLLQSIKKLDNNLKIIILLFYYEDLSMNDISRTLNIPSGTVKSRLSRARKKLFELMKGEEE